MLTISEIAKMMDVSAVQANSTLEDIDAACATAEEFGAAAVFCLPQHVAYMKSRLSPDSNVVLASVSGFPSGAELTETKADTARRLVDLGCGEVDMVNNIAYLKANMEKEYKSDVASVVSAAGGKPVKVILECHWLTDEETARASRWCMDAGASWVKTGTGWAPTGASVERCRIMKEAVGDACGVKAAGGVRTLDMLLDLYAVGVRRFGIGVKTARSILEEVSQRA
jgi:deoxyribose-phosphate aldolase